MKRVIIKDERAVRFAQNMVAGDNIKQSMMKAGYSEENASRGKAGITGKMLKALAQEGYKMSDFAKKFTMEEVKNVAMGRLLQNAIAGKDGGVMSAKTLGSHRDLNLWIPEAMAGVIVIAAPNTLQDKKDKLLAEDNES